MDAFEYQVRALVVREQLEEVGLGLEELCSLDPMLLDRLRDAIEEHHQDPDDKEAHERFLSTFVDFLEAVVEAMD